MTRLPLLVAATVFALPFVSARVQAQAAPASPLEAGRAAFERTWEAWERAPEGPAKDALALEVDRLAGQRYATVSHLYWHRDLASAIEAAEASGRPILALRMLGKLDEDLSCANSRFFRVVLYANEQLSDYLREHFELVWTSERPVPRAHIDFGDGRVLERTVAGNSAHFVLDRHGRPVDVLPGLYGPRAFLDALQDAEGLARDVAVLDDDGLATALAEFHGLRFSGLETVSLPLPIGPPPLASAQMLTRSKGPSEMPMVSALALGPQPAPIELDLQAIRVAQWTDAWARGMGPQRLDASSRALFARLAPADWNVPGQALAADAVDVMIDAFERNLGPESAANEYDLHDEVRRWFTTGEAPRDLAGLQAKVYGELFLTPADDPWLGMSTPGVFSALPGDGVILSGDRRR